MKNVNTIILFVFMTAKGFSQMAVTAPVLEAQSWENYLQMLIVADNSIQSVKNQIEQLNQMKKQFELQLNRLKHLERPESIGEAIQMFNEQITFVRNMEAKVKSQSITIGNTQIPLTEMYKIDQVYDIFNDDMRTILQTEYTDREKAYILSNFGLSPSNYMYLVEKRKRAEQAAATAHVWREKIISEDYEKRMQAVQDLEDRAGSAESDMEIAEIKALQQSIMNQQLSEMEILLGMMNESLAVLNTEIQAKPKAERLQKTVSDGFMDNIIWGNDGNSNF